MASLPVLVILGVFPEEISNLIFQTNGAEIPVRILALGGIFLYLQQTTTGILLGLGQANRILANTIIYASVRIFGILAFTYLGVILSEGNVILNQVLQPNLAAILKNGLGVISLAYILSYFIGAVVNYVPLCRRIISCNPGPDFMGPLFAAVGMGLLMLQLLNQVLQIVPISISILLEVIMFGLITYLILLVAGGSLNISETRRLLFDAVLRK
jgi:stage V sporulation protein B